MNTIIFVWNSRNDQLKSKDRVVFISTIFRILYPVGLV